MTRIPKEFMMKGGGSWYTKKPETRFHLPACSRYGRMWKKDFHGIVGFRVYFVLR